MNKEKQKRIITLCITVIGIISLVIINIIAPKIQEQAKYDLYSQELKDVIQEYESLSNETAHLNNDMSIEQFDDYLSKCKNLEKMFLNLNMQDSLDLSDRRDTFSIDDIDDIKSTIKRYKKICVRNASEDRINELLSSLNNKYKEITVQPDGDYEEVKMCIEDNEAYYKICNNNDVKESYNQDVKKISDEVSHIFYENGFITDTEAILFESDNISVVATRQNMQTVKFYID